MSDDKFKVGDRVHYNGLALGHSSPFSGTVEKIQGGTLEVLTDEGGEAFWGGPNLFTKIEDGPWRGECAVYNCRKPLEPGHANVYHFYEEGPKGPASGIHPMWYCDKCWNIFWEGHNARIEYQQALAVRRTKDFVEMMQERRTQDAENAPISEVETGA